MKRDVPYVAAALWMLIVLGCNGLMITFPPSIAGSYVIGVASFGLPLCTLHSTPRRLVVARPINGCGPDFDNAAQFAGSIVVMRRGGCTFATKAYAAQKLGAVGVVVQNTDMRKTYDEEKEALILMADDGRAFRVQIAVVMVTFSDGEILRKAIENDRKLVEGVLGMPLTLPNYLV